MYFSPRWKLAIFYHFSCEKRIKNLTGANFLDHIRYFLPIFPYIKLFVNIEKTQLFCQPKNHINNFLTLRQAIIYALLRFPYENLKCWGCSSAGRARLRNAEARGSIPLISTKT